MARTLILLYVMLALLAGALGTKHRNITVTKASSQASSPSAAAAAAATRRLLEQGHKGSQDTKRSPVLGLCYSRYSAFLPSIHEDLMSWSGAGITEAMMDEVLMERTFFEGWMGIPIIIKGGIPYMVGNRNASGIAPWFRTEFMIYSQVIIDLTKRYGKDIPDVEFVIMTDDEPGPLIDQDNMPPLPYFRYCKTDDHPEILIPCWHIYQHNYSATYLATIPEREALHPWHSRKQVLYNNPGAYHRYASHELTQKLNYTGEPTEMPRQAFADWARHANSSLIDVDYERYKELVDWAQFRYVAHVDGISCSCRLEKLLALGSLLIKEESNYRSFYHRLMKPMVHYVPFWRKLPQEALQAVKWAMENDAEAHHIAKNAQKLMQRYLHHQALDCYWLMLFREYRKLFRFTPGGPGRRYPMPLMRLADWVINVEKKDTDTFDEGVYVPPEHLELADPPGMEDPWRERS